MKTHLEKIGSLGALIAAAACPICFPKLALLGALFGLGALGAYESQLFVAAQVLIAVAVLGHALAYLQHRKGWLLGLAILSGVAVFGGLYLLRSEAMIYAGFAGLVVTSATDYWARFRRTPAPSRRSPSTNARAAVRSCARRRATAACFAPTVRRSARRCKPPGSHSGENHGSESKAVAAIGAAADRSFSGAQGELRVLEEVSRFHPQQHAHHAKETEAGEGVQPALPGDLGSE